MPIGHDIQPNGHVPSPAMPPASDRIPAIVPIRFWTDYKTTPGSEKPVEEDRVEWVKKGESGGATTSEAVKRLAPTSTRPGAIEWQVIGPAYDAWKKGNETPLNGTPLHAWSGVSREMADALKKFNIFTIEDLADFPDHQMQKIPLPHLREWRNRAKAWREAQATNDIGDKLAQRDRVIEAQSSQMAEMQEQVREMSVALNALKQTQANAAAVLKAPEGEDMPVANPGEKLVPAEPPAKRGPGRPRREG